MRIQLRSRTCASALRQGRRTACFGTYSHHLGRRSCLRSMTRARVSRDARDSIAFTGSRSDASGAELHDQQYVQGVAPAPAPGVEDDQRGPGGGSLWVAGLVLAAGFACSIAWRSLFGSSHSNSGGDIRYQQGDQAARAPLDQLRNLPQSIASSASPKEETESQFPNSLSAIKTLPVETNSASLQADARAIQARLTQPQRSYDTPADTSETSSRGPPSNEQQQPPGVFTEQPRSESVLSDAKPLVKEGDSPDTSGDSVSAREQGAAAQLGMAPAASDSEAPTPSKQNQDMGKAADVDSNQANMATAVAGPSDSISSSEAGNADDDDTRAAREELHDLISGSSDGDSDVPDAFKTFDSNLPDEPEPDATQQGPRLFQSAPQTETSLPKPQEPEATDITTTSAISQPTDSVTKPQAESQGESQAAQEPMHPGEATSELQERYEDQESNAALAEQASRQPLSELDVDSVQSSNTTSAQTDKPTDPKQRRSRDEDPAVSSRPELEPAERVSPQTQAESGDPSSSQQPKPLEAQEAQQDVEKSAAELRQRMQQLRQAMADKEAALAAGQSEQQRSDSADKEAALAAAESQQQQPPQQGSQQVTGSSELQQGISQPQDQQQQQQQQERQKPEDNRVSSGRVVPRAPSSESATIFVERPGADGDLQSHPVDSEGFDESDDADQAIDLVALSAGAVLPHPDKAETGGEDAFFVSSHGQGAFGVADGVGGWNMEGVDPSRYSRLLMEHAEQAIQQGQGDGEDGARDVVGLAHDSITTLGKKEGAVILGSSTICLGLVRPGGLLEMANVGDSGFRVIRGAETVFASESQQHDFNMPFQLATPGPDQYSDTSESATVYELELEPGDVVLLATDGVLDNMWDDQIAAVIHECLRDGRRSVAKAQECARAIVEAAQGNSFNPKFRSPWVVEAAKAGVLPWWQRFKPEGGKVDDCTAVVICMEPASAVQGSDAQAVRAGSSAAVSTR